MRARELVNWVESGAFEAVRSRETRLDSLSAQMARCSRCRRLLGDYEAFCPGCGLPLNRPYQGNR